MSARSTSIGDEFRHLLSNDLVTRSDTASAARLVFEQQMTVAAVPSHLGCGLRVVAPDSTSLGVEQVELVAVGKQRHQ